MRVPAMLALLAPLLAVGCGETPQARFALNERTGQLLPEAEDVVEQVLLENFGTPDDLVGWQRLPVDYGGYHGSVVSVPGEQGQIEKFTVRFEEEAADFETPLELNWLTGAYEGQTQQVLDYNAEAGLVSVSPPLEAPPGEGDTFVVGFGEVLAHGRMVYMRHCMHCHGVAGDGAGPTARHLYPRPRDYRLGIFKFTSTHSTEKVNRDDLQRTVRYGIPGTYMPSFLLFSDEELHAVVEYVRWLSMRGELEKRLDDELALDFSKQALEDRVAGAQDSYERELAAYNENPDRKEKPDRPSSSAIKNQLEEQFAEYMELDFQDTLEGTVDFLVSSWERAEQPQAVVVPQLARVEDTAESRERGRALYLSDRTKCYTCHGPLGRGDGAATQDFWKKPGSNEYYSVRGLHDVWGDRLKPRDLTRGQYRGGRRPLDLYRRVYAGIKGTPMPAFGGTVLKDEEIWDLVNYVMSVPFGSPSGQPGTPPQMARSEQQPSR